jgi:hypothetical protein
MPAHYCIDPLDPYAEQEVLVTFEERQPLPLLISVIDKDGFDIFSDLTDECVKILQLEIAVHHGHIKPFEWARDAVDVLSAPPAA